MIGLIFPLLMTTQHYRESNQLKTYLPNGATIFCESRPSSYVAVELILSNRDTPDLPTTYGYRHLLEHISARSIPGHDAEIEKAGGFLLASTSRDWMRFEWRLTPENLALAFKGIGQLLKSSGATEEGIKRESIAIGHELDLSTTVELTSRSAWREVYGADGIDPLGTLESTSAARVEDLDALWHKMTKGGNVVIAASGPLDQKSFTLACRDLLSGLPLSKPAPAAPRSISGTYGENSVVAVPIPSITTKASANALVAVFGLAGRLNRPFVTYTISDRPGLALVGSSDPFESVKKITDSEDPAVIFNVGRTNALRWLDSRLATPEGSAELNGTLLCISPSLRPSKIAENIQFASFAEFQRTWDLIKGVVK